jgi:hypothetical protein
MLPLKVRQSNSPQLWLSDFPARVQKTPIRMTADPINDLRSAIHILAFDEHNVENWDSLARTLACWKDPHEGGVVSCEYIDDELEMFLADRAQLIRSLFHISKMTPSESTRKSIMSAKSVFERIVAAIERAAIVAQIRGANVREPTSPCSTGERSPVVSPSFLPHRASPSRMLSKCK